MVEEKPVVTIFFLFTPCCFALLRMFLLELPVDILSVGLLNCEGDQSKRLTAVRSFYQRPDSPGILRRICLCLRLTIFATSLTAQKGASEKQRDPLLVRLGRGEVQKRTSALFRDIVQRLPDDPDVDQLSTFNSLLLTESHIIIRFGLYNLSLIHI